MRALRHWLATTDMTHADLASRLGVDRTAVTHWSTGRSTPTLGHLMELARLTGIPVEVLAKQAHRAGQRRTTTDDKGR